MNIWDTGNEDDDDDELFLIYPHFHLLQLS